MDNCNSDKLKGKICLIYNFAQHYRTSIFCLMDKNLNCDFVFGDKHFDVKKMDYSLLMNKVTEVHNTHWGPFYWQKNVVKQISLPYRKYIVLGQPVDISTWIIMIFARMLGKEVYLWSHGWYGKESFLKKVIKKAFFNLSHGVLLYGNYAKSLMVQNGINPNKLFVIHNSLDHEEQIRQRNKVQESDIYKLHFSNEYPNIIFIGRLSKVKNLDMLIKVISMAKKHGKKLNLTLIGDGDERNWLESLAINMEVVDNIWFYGPAYNEEVLSTLIYNADICVAPGNVGLTAIHCLVYGCPVITHNNFKMQMPEFEAIKEGVTGMFFNYNDTSSLYDVIFRWLECNKNREVVRKAAYDEIDNYWTPQFQLQIIKEALKI